jgi:hypothetical protein
MILVKRLEKRPTHESGASCHSNDHYSTLSNYGRAIYDSRLKKIDSPWTEVEVVIPHPQFSLINSFCVVSSIIFNSPFEFKQQRP